MARKTQGADVLVLGASGKLGRMVRAIWAKHPPETGAVRTVARDGSADFRWAPGDDPTALPQVGAVVALWGVTPGPGRDLADNSALAREAMELGAALGADRVLHCSSAAVYAPQSGAIAEAQAGPPPSAYGDAKRAMEAVVADWSQTRPEGPKGVCLRIGNVAGADSLFASLARPPELVLDRFADGQGPRRSYIAPSDLARVLAALATAPLADLPEVVNVAAPRATAMADIAQAAGRKVTWRAAPDSAVPEVWLSTSRLDRFLALDSGTADAAWLLADARRWADVP